MSITLTPEELVELTDRPQPKRQITWLTERGWKFEIGAAGFPKVSRSYYEQRMAGKQASHWEPDWSKV